jgi:hypothetical protein
MCVVGFGRTGESHLCNGYIAHLVASNKITAVSNPQPFRSSVTYDGSAVANGATYTILHLKTSDGSPAF